MAIEVLQSFIAEAHEAAASLWTESKLGKVAALNPASELFGPRELLIRADIHILWSKWFLTSICDPEPFVAAYPGYAHVVARVLPEIHRLFPSSPRDEKTVLVSKIARLIDREIQRRQDAKRTASNRDLRLQLWDEAGAEPRCWICGYRFDQIAANEFIGIASDLPSRAAPLFIDYLKPKGLTVRDFKVEIDHAVPVNAGGSDGDNLRLACGWCNAHKSDFTSIYDVSGECKLLRHPSKGSVAGPRPYWVVRLLAIRRRCEWAGGCKATVQNEELTVAPIHANGAMNPLNLHVTCMNHDSVGPSRLLPREVVNRMWNS